MIFSLFGWVWYRYSKKVCTTPKKIIAPQKYAPFGQNSLYLQNSCKYYLGVSVVAVRYLIWGQKKTMYQLCKKLRDIQQRAKETSFCK